MATEAPQRKLHWNQRIALVRHNLHIARRTGDYAFFKTLQAHTVLDGMDHVANLHSLLNDDADSTLSTLDNLNAGIAYVHQDAFRAVYDAAKSTIFKSDISPSSRRSLLRVDISQQRDMADLAIDKSTNSAINLIESQPPDCQEAIANAWITGATIIADAVCICLKAMDDVVEEEDFIRLEYLWNTVQNSVDAAISALRGIFNLMATSDATTEAQNMAFPPKPAPTASAPPGRRQSSAAQALGLIKRALNQSSMLAAGPPPAKSSRTGSVSVPDANSRGFRMSISAACPTRMPNYSEQQPAQLSPIPPTPLDNTPAQNPFLNKNDYFAFDMEKNQEPPKPDASEDLLHLDSLDPLYPSGQSGNPENDTSLTLRNMSEPFSVSPPSPITV